MRLFDKYEVDSPVKELFVDLKSLLSVTAHPRNLIKYDCISGLELFIELCPSGTIHPFSGVFLRNDDGIGILFFYGLYLSFYILLFCAHSCIPVNTHESLSFLCSIKFNVAFSCNLKLSQKGHGFNHCLILFKNALLLILSFVV